MLTIAVADAPPTWFDRPIWARWRRRPVPFAFARHDAPQSSDLMQPAFFKEKVQAEKQRDRALRQCDELSAKLDALQAERDAAVADLERLRREPAAQAQGEPAAKRLAAKASVPGAGVRSATVEAALEEILTPHWPALDCIELRFRRHPE